MEVREIIRNSLLISSIFLTQGCVDSNSKNTDNLLEQQYVPNNGEVVTVERGPLLFGEISDANDQKAIMINNSSNSYRFINPIVYPIKTDSLYSNSNVYGIIDVNQNGMVDSVDIQLDEQLISSKDEMTLLTTILYDESAEIERLKGEWLVKLFNLGLLNKDKVTVSDLYQLPSENRPSAYLNNVLFNKLKTDNITLLEVSEQLGTFTKNHGDFMDQIEDGYHEIGDYNATLQNLNLFLSDLQTTILDLHEGYLERINEMENIFSVGTNPHSINLTLENHIVTEINDNPETSGNIQKMGKIAIWEFVAHIKDKQQQYSGLFPEDPFGNILIPDEIVDPTAVYIPSTFELSDLNGDYNGTISTIGINCDNNTLSLNILDGSITGNTGSSGSVITGTAIENSSGGFDITFADSDLLFTGVPNVEGNESLYDVNLTGNWNSNLNDCSGTFNVDQN